MPDLYYILTESMSSQTHQAHITLSELMTSIIQLPAHLAHITLRWPVTSTNRQGLSLGSCPIPRSFISHYKLTFLSLTLCQVLSGGRQQQIALICCSSLAPGNLVHMLGGQTMTIIDLHCTRPSCLVNLWPASSPGIHARKFSKG